MRQGNGYEVEVGKTNLILIPPYCSYDFHFTHGKNPPKVIKGDSNLSSLKENENSSICNVEH